MKPESFDIFLDIFNNIAANFRDYFLLREIKSMKLYFESFDMFTESDDSSEVSKEIGEYFRFVKMPIS
jgi:hypothetical protein